MDALDIAGVTLAQELTDMRDDGRETVAATISRWLNGVSPVEPAVLCWLRELVRARVRQKRGGVQLMWGDRTLRIDVTMPTAGTDVESMSLGALLTELGY
jgi:hypothetical protein